MRVGVIGAGLIGGKRTAALLAAGDKCVAVADHHAEAARKLSLTCGAEIQTGMELIQRSDIDAVIIATSNDAIAPYAIASLENKKPILIEKPGGRFPAELRAIENAAANYQTLAAVGFNHRFHPALQLVKRRLAEIGRLMYFRARYGHGGRIGYDQEWRADPKMSGGGELLDQGVHLIDLCRWLGGEFTLDFGRVHTFFWNMPVEDNGFVLLKSPDQTRFAWLHASCTEWKNVFELEIFGDRGKLLVTGLGRSYGEEQLKIFKVKPEMGVPLLETVEFPQADASWDLEWRAFKDEINGRPSDIAKIGDGTAAVSLVHQVYQQSKMPFARE